MVELIKKRGLEDLYLLGAKGRHPLHDLLDEGKTKMIETIALVDRTFQQRRLLEGGTTAHVGILDKIIVAAEGRLGMEAKQTSPQSELSRDSRDLHDEPHRRNEEGRRESKWAIM